MANPPKDEWRVVPDTKKRKLSDIPAMPKDLDVSDISDEEAMQVQSMEWYKIWNRDGTRNEAKFQKALLKAKLFIKYMRILDEQEKKAEREKGRVEVEMEG